MRKHHATITFIAALTLSSAARAEAALADLIFLMPKIILVGIYYEVSRPWVLGCLWGAALLCWMVHAVTGRDAVGDLLDILGNSRRPLFNVTSYGAFAFWAAACTLVTLVGYAVLGAPQRSKSAHTGRPAHAKPQPNPLDLAPKVLPYPYRPSPGNPRGEWPVATGALPDQPMLEYRGKAYLRLSNPGNDALWARLCRAEDEPCRPVRQALVSPRHSYLVERVAEGRYRVLYTQVTGSLLSGSTPAFRVQKDPADLETLALTDFVAPPGPPPQPPRAGP